MMFPAIKLLALSLSLDGCVTAHPVALQERAKNVIIGYRTVHPDQAARYNKARTLTNDVNIIGTQIGKGVYTTAKPGGWPGGNNDWHCVIWADLDAMRAAHKAWIPENYAGARLWFTNDLKKIDTYITNEARGQDSAKTIRMSLLEGMQDDDFQLVIPPRLLNSNGGKLGITASCRPNLANVGNQVVDYNDFIV